MLIYLIRPRASLSCRLERWPLGIYFTEMVAEFFGEAFDDFRVTGAKVVLFADIVGDVEQLFLASAVIVNQFPDLTINELSKMIKRYKDNDAWMKNTYFTEESFDHLQDIMIEAGELKTKVPYKDLVDTSFSKSE